jgi:hypothetical protein
MYKNLISNIYKNHLVRHSRKECLAELLDRSYFISKKMKNITEVIDNYKKYYISKLI